MAAIAIVSFVIGFQPIRSTAKQGPIDINGTFRFSLPQAIVTTDAEKDTKANELKQALVTGGIETKHINGIKILGNNLIEVETLPLTEEQAKGDEAKILQILGTQYQGIKDVSEGTSSGSQEEPLLRLGSSFAIYRPRPNIRLGLDLQGGAHVVLRCLPSTKMTFSSPEGKPMAEVEGAQAKTPEGATPAPAPKNAKLQSGEELAGKVKTTLVRNGVPEDECVVKMVAPNLLSIETRANDDKTANREQKLVQEYLTEQLAGVLKPEEIVAGPLETVFVGPDTADKVKDIIDRRLYSMGDVREPLIQKQGADRLIIELPGVKDPERVIDTLKSTAMLEFRLIPKRYSAPGAERDDYSEWQDQTTGQTVPWERVMAESEAKFTGRDLESNSTIGPGDKGDWVVHFNMRQASVRAFSDFTGQNVGRLMAIVLDGKCQMAPVIRSRLQGGGIIEGKFSAEDAGRLKLLLNAGALPVPLEIAEKRAISATLGEDAIHKSLMAGIIGLSLVLLFMVAYYRLPGLMADVALALYVLMLFALMALAGTTLTLPGIAGVILSIGMAVDANVIIFERLKEELWAGKTMRAAIDAGFKRAWTAIIDANVTTLITCSVLYFLGTSVIKSFAVTLFLGVAASLFTAVTVSYWLVSIVADTEYGQKHHLYGVRMPAEETK
jgi:protein-export membrane protein SecD